MLRWLERKLAAPAPAPAASAPAPFSGLRITGRAMCCAVGHHAASATAALNARMNLFRTSDFVDGLGEPLVAGMVHGLDAWGAERMAVLLHQVIAEAMAQLPDPASGETLLLINGPEAARQGLPREALLRALDDVLVSWPQLKPGGLLPHGQGGIARSLRHAAACLKPLPGQAPCQRVLLVGLDSLLFAGSIEQLIEQDRLASKANSDGFIPAEAAAALLLEDVSSVPGHAQRGLLIEAAEVAEDPWRIDGEAPQLGAGLTAAVRQALIHAKTELADLDFQLSGATGEGWVAREAALMQSRCMKRKRTHFEHLMPSQFVGFCGGALPILSLAWLADVMGRQDSPACPGRSALLHFADPCGDRSALVVRHIAAASHRPQGI